MPGRLWRRGVMGLVGTYAVGSLHCTRKTYWRRSRRRERETPRGRSRPPAAVHNYSRYIFLMINTKWFRVASLFLAWNGVVIVVAARGAEKPNIVFIMADDLGNADLGYRGGEIKTPNIDKLATTGVRCESFYGMPVCTPSRAALMTGRYPIRHGLQTLVIFPSHGYGLPTDERTLPQALKDGRLPDLHGRQVASRPRRPEILAAEPRLRPLLRQSGRRGGLFHQGARRRDRLAAQRRVPQGGRVLHDPDRQRSGQADRRPGPGEAVLPLLRLAGPPRAFSGAQGVQRPLRLDPG